MMFENRVPRRIFGPKRDEVPGSWRKLHDEDFHNLYSSPSIIRTIKKDNVCTACSTNWGIKLMHIGYWRKSQKESDH
jgi:hypothetical protein